MSAYAALQVIYDNQSPCLNPQYDAAEDFGASVAQKRREAMQAHLYQQDVYDILETLSDVEFEQFTRHIRDFKLIRSGLERVAETEGDKAKDAYLDAINNPARLMAVICKYQKN